MLELQDLALYILFGLIYAVFNDWQCYRLRKRIEALEKRKEKSNQ